MKRSITALTFAVSRSRAPPRSQQTRSPAIRSAADRRFPIARAVEVPAGYSLVFHSGLTPAPANDKAEKGYAGLLGRYEDAGAVGVRTHEGVARVDGAGIRRRGRDDRVPGRRSGHRRRDGLSPASWRHTPSTSARRSSRICRRAPPCRWPVSRHLACSWKSKCSSRARRRSRSTTVIGQCSLLFVIRVAARRNARA